MKAPTPTHREAVALFRLGVIGDLLAMELNPGELKDELVRRSLRRYRAPDSNRTRSYHWKTLQRWYLCGAAHKYHYVEPGIMRSRGSRPRVGAHLPWPPLGIKTGPSGGAVLEQGCDEFIGSLEPPAPKLRKHHGLYRF